MEKKPPPPPPHPGRRTVHKSVGEGEGVRSATGTKPNPVFFLLPSQDELWRQAGPEQRACRAGRKEGEGTWQAGPMPSLWAGPGGGWPNQTCLRPSLMTNWPEIRPHNTIKVSELKMWFLGETGTEMFSFNFARTRWYFFLCRLFYFSVAFCLPVVIIHSTKPEA